MPEYLRSLHLRDPDNPPPRQQLIALEARDEVLSANVHGAVFDLQLRVPEGSDGKDLADAAIIDVFGEAWLDYFLAG